MKVAIYGATGYTGHELLRLLVLHPAAEIVCLMTSSHAGQNIRQIYPDLWQDLPVLTEEGIPEADVVFCALPHGLTAVRARDLLKNGLRIIDLGADFRLSQADYEKWYGLTHPAPALLSDAVYGLPEFYRAKIAGTQILANPGCYPTASLLALRPLLKAGLLEPRSLIVDAASGVSGAGKSIKADYLFAEVNENYRPYAVSTHRHTPEIEQELSLAAGTEIVLQFTPHLLPMTRGILATIYASPQPGVAEADLRAAWQDAYAEETFVRILPAGVWPQTKMAYGSNMAFLQLTLDQRTGRVVIVSCLDNLLKGATGQAVQNLNIMYGLAEDTGLGMSGLWP
jgi:N-acetyl-gamma-glutamyl-phosphate reductase